MMRKKLTNKDKFLFKEEDVLSPPPVPSRVSAQSRLTRKVDNSLAYNPTVGGRLWPPVQIAPSAAQTPNHRTSKNSTPHPGSDPVLDAVVAKLKSGLYLSPDAVPGLVSQPCLCMRPLKLIMCAECGMTFPARLKLSCPAHPHDIYLLDVEECKGCKQNRKEALLEYDLPEGMEAGIKNTRIM
eukprot:GFUD01027529.1.p1 GENE.GFUD01027529.1~~GFUD01027529.1.p1  ORF type:complete len:183 (-),score=52.32 GFUD01027529.1:132-680(-)